MKLNWCESGYVGGKVFHCHIGHHKSHMERPGIEPKHNRWHEPWGLDLDWLATGRTRKHLGLYLIRPIVRRLCLFSSVIYSGTRTAPSVRPSRGRAPNRSGRTESSISEEGKLRARNGRLNFVLWIRLPRNRKRFLTCRKSTTRDPPLTSLPKEGMLRIFYARKKSDAFGRVWTRDLGYQRPAC
jgi:hypothetical protein